MTIVRKLSKARFNRIRLILIERIASFCSLENIYDYFPFVDFFVDFSFGLSVTFGSLDCGLPSG